jgi:hypothetical protein
VTGLTIRSLRADVASPEPMDRDRVNRLQWRLVERTLNDRRAGFHGLSGEWCVRRLEIELELDAAEPDATAAERWADVIATSVRSLVADGSLVIHYPNRGWALAELVLSLTTGSSDRAWAWRQLGLLADFHPDPQTNPVGALLAALSREPQLAASAVTYAVRHAGLESLDRLLGEAGWVALASVVATDVPLGLLRETELSMVAEQARAAVVVANSSFAHACLSSPLEPSVDVAAAWAALITTEVEPGRPRLAAAVAIELEKRLRLRRSQMRSDAVDDRPSTSSWRRWSTSQKSHWLEVGTSATGMQQPVTGNDDGYRVQGAANVSEDQRAGNAESKTGPNWSPLESPPPGLAASNPILPSQNTVFPTGTTESVPSDAYRSGYPIDTVDSGNALDVEARRGAETAWAGLLFLLNTAEWAGIPDALDEDPRLMERTLRWSLHELAQRLVPVPANDPAALALAGLPPGSSSLAGPPPTDVEDVALAEHAGAWADLTRDVLGEAQPDNDQATMTIWGLARRRGQIVADPGWLEVHMDLDTVDVQVRRAGLDIDPGWVSWLGTVVRFCYV